LILPTLAELSGRLPADLSHALRLLSPRLCVFCGREPFQRARLPPVLLAGPGHSLGCHGLLSDQEHGEEDGVILKTSSLEPTGNLDECLHWAWVD